jgi:hypothetical protein
MAQACDADVAFWRAHNAEALALAEKHFQLPAHTGEYRLM